jgi:hypothetical protein
MVANSGIEIGDGFFAAVVNAFGFHEAIVGNPQHTAGDRGGAAHQFSFLKHQHAFAGFLQYQCGTQ